MTTGLNLLSQQKVESEHETEGHTFCRHSDFFSFKTIYDSNVYAVNGLKHSDG